MILINNMAIQGGASNGHGYSQLMKEIEYRDVIFKVISGASAGGIASALIGVGASYNESKAFYKNLKGDYFMRMAHKVQKKEFKGAALIWKGLVTLGVTRFYIYNRMKSQFKEYFQWEFVRRAHRTDRVYICWFPIEFWNRYADIAGVRLTNAISAAKFVGKFKGTLSKEEVSAIARSASPIYSSHDGQYIFNRSTGKLELFSEEVIPMWKCVLATFWNPVFPNLSMRLMGQKYHAFDGGIANNEGHLPFFGQEYYQAVCNEPPPVDPVYNDYMFMSKFNYNLNRPPEDHVLRCFPKTQGLAFFDFNDSIIDYEFDGRMSRFFEQMAV